MVPALRRGVPPHRVRDKQQQRGDNLSDYDPLRDYLKKQTRDEFTMTIEEIETLLDLALPRASHRASWWDITRAPEEKMPQRVAIIDGGYEATRLPDGSGVKFRRQGLRRKWR